MRERREYERFDLRLPAQVEIFGSNGKEIFHELTSDLSAGGVYFNIRNPISEGTQVRLKLSVLSERLRELTGAEGFVEVEGVVIRCRSTGIAICFNGDYQIARLPKS
jgi:hypothetical protein